MENQELPKGEECSNCQGENGRTGYVELWDNICPECGRHAQPGEPFYDKEAP